MTPDPFEQFRPLHGQVEIPPSPLAPASGNSPSGHPGITILCWFIILGLTAALFLRTAYMQIKGPPPQGDATPGELMNVNLQAKFLAGQNQMDSILGNSDDFDEDAEEGDPLEKIAPEIRNRQENTFPLPDLDFGPPEQRWAYAILINEYRGPSRALKQIGATADEDASRYRVRPPWALP